LCLPKIMVAKDCLISVRKTAMPLMAPFTSDTSAEMEERVDWMSAREPLQSDEAEVDNITLDKLSKASLVCAK
jgi:hypothetical protein